MFNQPTMQGASIACVLSMALTLSGCVMPTGNMGTRESGTPISSEKVNKLVKLKSTKLDVIELFGMPAMAAGVGQYPMGMQGIPQGNSVLSSGSDEIFVYKHCTSGKSGPLVGLVNPLNAFKTKTASTEEQCEQLAVLIGKDEIVRSFGYFPIDPVIQDNVSKLVKGKSKKAEAIEKVGAPTNISASGNDEIFSYKICITSIAAGAFSGAKTTQDCKQLTLIFDKNSEVIKGMSFQPFQ